MTHIALARKYRPKQFADLAGQEHVAAGLAGAVAKGRVAHAYLLTGPRGVGKTSAARILAMALNCERRGPQGEPCGACDSCMRIWSGGANLDVVEIDAASNRGVDDARDLRERAMYAASGPDRHKVYIVDEAHMLTREAWNALLKVLEEPPPRVVFVFATTEPIKIANTAAPVLSRVQRFDFRRISPGAVTERLRHVASAERITAEDPALQLIARIASGGMRDALSLLDQSVAFGDGAVTVAGVRSALGLIDDEQYAQLLAMLAERRTADVFPFVAGLVDAGADLAEFINGAGELLRAVMLRIVEEGNREQGKGNSTANLVETSDAVRRAVDEYAGRFEIGDLLRMLKLLAEAEQVIRRSPNARLHVETLLLQWTLLDRTVELAEVVEAMKGGQAVRRSGGEGEAGGQAVRRSGGQATPAKPDPSLNASELTAQPPDRLTPPPPDRPSGDLTLDAIRAAWPSVLDIIGRKKRMLRESLAHATPAVLAGGILTVAVDGAVHLEGLERSRAAMHEALSEAMGRAVPVVFQAAGAGGPTPAAEPVRLDPRSDRDERLRSYRAKDPALNQAAELLDLELTE